MTDKYCSKCAREYPWDHGDGECVACGASSVVDRAYDAGWEHHAYNRTDLRRALGAAVVAIVALIALLTLSIFSYSADMKACKEALDLTSR